MAQHASGETRTITERFIDWCARDTDAARFQRSVAQGVIGVGVACLTSISEAPEIVTILVIPTVMVVLAPIQSAIGKGGKVGDSNE